MTEYKLKVTSNKADIKDSTGFIEKGWASIKISEKMVYIYISKHIGRIYWIGRRNGISAGLTIKFSDSKKMIKINSSNKIYFHNAKDYERLKDAAIANNYLKPGKNEILFRRRDERF